MRFGTGPRGKKARGRPVASNAQKLGFETIVDAALQLLDKGGLEALSMRGLAQRLGVQASALYWHLGDKSELYGLMAWRFYQRAIDAAGGSKSWEEWLRRFGLLFHGALCAHRDAAQLCAIARPRDQDPESTGDKLAAPLVLLGLSRDEALIRLASVISLALGWAVYEQSETQRDYLAHMVALDTGFETGLRALLAGFSLNQENVARPAVRQFVRVSTRRRS
jgi:TetR/AcrR family transcriptional regulator, tetracycline repressor protein